MTPDTMLKAAAWYRALPLSERVRSLRNSPHAGLAGPVDSELARRRGMRWESQPPFGSGTCFDDRLAQDGLTKADWSRLLGEASESVRDRCESPPYWVEAVARAYAAPRTDRGFPLPTSSDIEGMLGFLTAVRPLLDEGWDRLVRGIEALCEVQPGALVQSDSVAEVLAVSLPWRLTQMLNRTMILELNVARLSGQLAGESAEARYQGFLQRIDNRDIALALLQEYPVLARQVTLAIDQWVQFSLEFLQHLCHDWAELREAFSPNGDPGYLVEVDESGDQHRGGRSVLIARFSSGFRLVYKPKPLAVDRHYQDLLAWINHHGHEPAFRPLAILDRGDYGWVEYVESRDCQTASEVRRFYERQGGQLALLYVLEATDLHSENLIASGEYPIFVDLETLFHPLTPATGGTSALGGADTFLDRSVLRTGLLPERIWSGADQAGIDISGLGAGLEQQTPFGVPRWESAGTDEMRVVYRQVTLTGAANRPTLKGQPVEVPEYAGAVADGFARVYRLMQRYRSELLAPDGPIARFAHDEVRVILRPTTTYCVLLRESFHPDMLRSGLDRDQLFDRLWAKVPELPYLAPAIRYERDDLWQGDIPVFTTRPDSRDLWSSGGDRIANYFDQNAMTLVERRLKDLCDSDLAQQTWVIRGSLATLSGASDRDKRPTTRPSETHRHVEKSELLEAARRVGVRLEELALRDANGVSWVGLSAIDERRCTLELLGPDLYDGLPGVITFLAYLGAITGESRWTDLGRAALPTLIRLVQGPHPRVGSIGAFSGWGGIVHALVHWGSLWADTSLWAEAESVVERLPALIEQDDHFDLVTGAAGCLVGLANLYRTAPSERVRQTARLCGEHLLTHAMPAGAGLGWPSPLPADGPLTGLSHGASGMALALLELAALTGEDRYSKAAKAAICYERGLFSSREGNWPDLRAGESDEAGPPKRFATAWCHGAPGIGLARLHSLQHIDDSEARGEIAAAVQATVSHGVGSNHSLCHGDLGNLELLLVASQSHFPDCRVDRDRWTVHILDDIQARGWICGVPQGIESPGLMTGLAGIGYGLLRLAEPRRVPSLLTLAPPERSR